MTHSIETHKRAYEEIGTAARVAKAHKIVKALVRKDEDDTRKKRIKWASQHVKNLENFFKEEIQHHIHAKIHVLGSCVILLSLKSLEKMAHQNAPQKLRILQRKKPRRTEN